MPIENSNLMNIYTRPQKYTTATDPAAQDSKTADTAKLASQPEKDTLQLSNKPAAEAVSNKKKGIIAAVVTVLATVGIIVATRGRGAKKLAKEAEEKAAKELLEKTAAESRTKAVKEAEARLAKELKDTAVKKAEKKAAEELEKKSALELAEKTAKEAQDKLDKEIADKALQEANEKAAKEAQDLADKIAAEDAEKLAAQKLKQQAIEAAEELKFKNNALKDADEMWQNPQKRAELEDFFKNIKLNVTKSNVSCEMVDQSIDEALTNSIKGQMENVPEYLYHGTSPENYQKIMENGFDLSKCKRGDSGQGAYFGLSEDAVKNAYGKSVVKVKYAGDKVAKVEPGVVDGLTSNTSVRFAFQDKLGLDACESKSDIIIDRLLNNYFKEKLAKSGFNAVYAPFSHKASCGYIAVFDPKNINIIK